MDRPMFKPGVILANLGASPPAGPAYRRVVAQELKAGYRETIKSYLNWQEECKRD